ncbi:MAG TPA: hemerythrin domain-containing protein [Gammaproteobacteria bacterium]|nr:hemerythrin domain-containing protein [Gammaproteobacteria bacterium]
MKPLILFSRDTSGKSPSEHPPKQYAPGTRLAYDPALPGRLQQQHRDILDALQDVIDAVDGKKYRQAHSLLLDFRSHYQGHLYEKKQRFIPYLNHCLAGEGKHSEVTLRISTVSRHLEHRIMDVVRRFEQDGISDASRADCIRELQHMQKDLVRHMREKEEFIYPMYQPPEAYQAN